jgi:hypothetical protein
MLGSPIQPQLPTSVPHVARAHEREVETVPNRLENKLALDRSRSEMSMLPNRWMHTFTSSSLEERLCCES